MPHLVIFVEFVNFFFLEQYVLWINREITGLGSLGPLFFGATQKFEGGQKGIFTLLEF